MFCLCGDLLLASHCYHHVMLFTSATFLFLFLPAVLLLYFSVRGIFLRNLLLLLASIVFYLWGELSHAWIFGLLIVFNYFAAIAIDRLNEKEQQAGVRKKSFLLLTACAVNLAALIRYKYDSFFAEAWNSLAVNCSLPLLAVTHHALPLGISFFVFHCISYLVDIHRGRAQAQKDPVKMALYIALFPQLIAGPIIRFSQICDQFVARSFSSEKFAIGVRRFIIGLGKKLILANSFAVPADAIFALDQKFLSPDLAWLGAIAYALQLYFDFSGYTDMAIGLGHMFGFTFPENFNYPYISQSVQDFWKRWHMTLSGWFRDYVYIPLGGNQRGHARTAINLFIVFLLCGLWHGANWTFVFWGLYHGLFLSIERLGLGRLLNMIPQPFRHAYTLLVVLNGWVFFRAETLDKALGHLNAMWSFQPASGGAPELSRFLTAEFVFLFVLGAIACTPFLRYCSRLTNQTASPTFGKVGEAALLISVLCLAIAEVSACSYSPFIYFHF